MTNGELFPAAEREVRRTSELDGILRVAISHVDAVRHSRNVSGYNTLDYVNPFVDRAYRSGIDMTEEEATHYIDSFFNHRSRREPDPFRFDAVPDSQTFQDTIHRIARDRIDGPTQSPTVSPEPEPQGEDND